MSQDSTASQAKGPSYLVVWQQNLNKSLLAQLAMLCTFYGLANVLRPRRMLAYLKARITGKEQTQLDALLRSKRRLRPGHPVPEPELAPTAA
jgi:hypothetical protein